MSSYSEFLRSFQQEQTQTYLQAFGAFFTRWKSEPSNDPSTGIVVAQNAVAYAQGLGQALMASALGLLGSSLKTVHNFSEAEKAFRKGLDLLPEEYRQERVDLLRRFVYLRADERKFDEALSLLDDAMSLSSGMAEHVQATVLLAKGYLLGEMGKHRDALWVSLEVLSKLDLGVDSDSADIALHNIIVAVSLDDRLEMNALQRILRELDAARCNSVRKGEAFRVKLKWIEAIVNLRFGINNKALAMLIAARRTLRRGSRPSIAFAMISIDIAQAHLQSSSLEKCREHLNQSLSELRATAYIAPEVCEAFSKCIAASEGRQFDIEILSDTRRALLKPRHEVDSGVLQTAQLSGD